MPPEQRRGAVSYQQLLDAVAASVPSDPLPTIEVATITRLLRAVPWAPGSVLISLLATGYPALAIRAANAIRRTAPGVQVVGRGLAGERDGHQSVDLVIPAHELDTATAWLRRQWDLAAACVVGQAGPEQRTAAARTMWRAALLVSSSDRRRSQIRVRVPDPAVMPTLRRAGEALGLQVCEHSRRGNCYFVTVDDPGQGVRLLRLVGAGPHAEAWVNGSTRSAPRSCQPGRRDLPHRSSAGLSSSPLASGVCPELHTHQSSTAPRPQRGVSVPSARRSSAPRSTGG